MHETRSLGHADQTEGAIDTYRLRVKADTVICDCETKLAAINGQFDACGRPPPLCLTTLCRASCVIR